LGSSLKPSVCGQKKAPKKTPKKGVSAEIKISGPFWFKFFAILASSGLLIFSKFL